MKSFSAAASPRSSSLSKTVRIVEVGPRDGLQNIKTVIPTSIKIELIKRLASCGNSIIEATSFVSPKWVPQLADGAQVLNGIQNLMKDGKINFPVLVPNTKGLESAIKSGVKETAVFISASEGFSQKNINCSVAESLRRVQKVVTAANQAGVRVRGYVSCIFACPFDGPTSPEAVLRVTQALLDMGCYEISLGDTLGVGTVADVERLLSLLLATIEPQRLAGHYHDTYGQAVANVLRSYSMGIRVFDSSVAGLGGCPYAPGAKGNVATEDIVYAFDKLGISTGINLQELIKVGGWISNELRIQNSSRVGAALLSKTQSLSTSPRPVPTEAQQSYKWHQVSATEDFSVAASGSTIRITLTRPKRGNVLTLNMLHGLTNLLHKLAKDETIFRIVITGQGKYFCTGMDLGSRGSVTAAGAEAKKMQFDALTSLFQAIDQSPQVTIAAINGPCYGGGIGLAFSCDIRIATAATTFTLSEAKLGLAPAVISKYVVREWGVPLAREAMLSARPVPAVELQKLGVVTAVTKDIEELGTCIDGYLSRLDLAGPRASTLCKHLVRATLDEQNSTIERTFYEMMLPSKEAQYGVEQFRAGVKRVDWQRLYSKRETKL